MKTFAKQDKNFPQVFHVLVADQIAKTALENFVMMQAAQRRNTIAIAYAQSDLSWQAEKLAQRKGSR